MSGKMRSKNEITQDLLKKEFVEPDLKKSALQGALFRITRDHDFLGAVLQSLHIQYSHMLPTAGITFNNDLKRWDMFINPYRFCKIWTLENRQAVLLHEILHILHKHPLRVAFQYMPHRKRQLMNIGMDMAINQLIAKGLPKGCDQCPPHEMRGQIPCPNEKCPGYVIFVEDYFDEKKDKKTGKITKTPWPRDLSAEEYYEKLCLRFKDPDPQSDDSGEGEGEGQGQGQGQGEGDGEGEGQGKGKGKGKGRGNAGGGADTSDLPDTLDEHNWDGSGDESEQLEATNELIKRALIKSNYGFDKLPDFVKETLQYIEARRAELDYKKLIMLAMKSSIKANYRVRSWTRKSRRYGTKAPGTTYGEDPKLNFYMDSSGSISIEEMNEFLGIMDEFLKVGAHQCRLNIFHTRNYYSEEYKRGERFDESRVESGGTDLEESMADIYKRKPDLAVFLTDGYYSNVNVEEWMKRAEKFPHCLFIISKDGTENHPLKRLGTTIKIPST